MKLKQFYETTEQRVPFNELSVESLDILEQSDAYKSYCKALKRLDAFLYVESIVLSLIGTLAIGILLLNELLKNWQ
jgi:hypothetical protein